MIYTIGYESSYLKAISESEDGTIYKLGKYIKKDGTIYAGGCAFRTLEDAQEEATNRGDGFVVFGLDADWETDTEPNEFSGSWEHNLLRDARIIVLKEQ